MKKQIKTKTNRAYKNKTRRLKKGLEFTKWKERSRAYWLTIKDIENMKNGEKMHVLMLDRNALDSHDNTIRVNKLYKPSTFFKNNKEIYTHSHKLYGNITYHKDSITFNKKNGFHVEYTKNNWYPLMNDHLPSKDPQKIVQLLGKRVNWKHMKKSTHIGWRGPLIKWSDLKKLPNVYLGEYSM